METDIHALMADEKSAKVNNADGKDTNVHSTEEIIRNLLDRNVTKQTLDRCKWELIAADRLKALESELLQKKRKNWNKR